MPLTSNELLRTSAASDVVLVTKANSDLPGGVCRGLWVGTAGTAFITTAAGGDRDSVPLQQGMNPIMCLRVRPGGTASDIWAMY